MRIFSTRMDEIIASHIRNNKNNPIVTAVAEINKRFNVEVTKRQVYDRAYYKGFIDNLKKEQEKEDTTTDTFPVSSKNLILSLDAGLSIDLLKVVSNLEPAEKIYLATKLLNSL